MIFYPLRSTIVSQTRAWTNLSLKGLVTKTLLLKMKLTVVFFVLFCFQAGAAGYSQNVTLSLTDAPLKSVFRELERQSGLTFYYKEELLDPSRKITVRLKDVPISRALQECVVRQNLGYVIIGKTIVVREGRISATEILDEKSAVLNIITGTVRDETASGELLAGASVTNTNTGQTVITDKAGRFTMQASLKDVLLISFIGYRDTKFTISSIEAPVSIVLKKLIAALDEAVVVGYGTTRKRDLTGSVSTIDGKEFRDIPFVSFDNVLAGKAPGVQITKTDGTPGGAVRVRVRGSTSLLGGNDPLYVIDGIPVQVQSNFISPGFDVGSPAGNDVNGYLGVSASMSTGFVNGLNSLGALNPDDIESISILKDASSAAIYGSKAANGVVLITTRRGKKDMKPQVTFNYYNTLSKPLLPKLLNSAQYKTLITEAAENSAAWRLAEGLSLPASVDAVLNRPEEFFGQANTDWLKEVTRNTISQNAEISIAGGGSSSKYFTSLSYTRAPGVIKKSDYERVSGKITLENEIGSKLRFITNLIAGYVNQDITNGVYGQALRARPDIPPYDSAGLPSIVQPGDIAYMGYVNPFALLSSLNNSKTLTLMGSLSAVYDISRDIQLKSIVSLNSQTYNQRNYTPGIISVGSIYDNVYGVQGGIGSNSNSRLSNWFIENTLTYNRQLKNKSSVNVLAGTSYETRKTSFFSATAGGYPDDYVLNNLSSASKMLLARGDDPGKPQSYLLSFYLRANYSLQDKYLFTFTGRADGSSKFGPQNKFGYFPSGAFAWRMSEENFLSGVKWLSDLKWRVSYGLTGTQNIGDQMYRTLYTPFTYAGSSALVPTQMGNAAIRWEVSKSLNVGADMGLFNNRLTLTADYYERKTQGALLSLPVATSSSFTSLLSNAVDINNSGTEISLSGEILRTANFRWSGSANITFNKSIVTKINPKANLSQIGNRTGLELNNTTIVEGQPLGLLKGMNVVGIIRDQKELDEYKAKIGMWGVFFFPHLGIGDPMFTLNPADDYGQLPIFADMMGPAAPKSFGGLTQNLSYKNFDLGLYFTFSQGGRLVWADHISSIKFKGTANANVVMLNRYTPDNPNSSQPRLVLEDQYINNSSLSVFNSSYLKLRSVNLNYNFQKTRALNQIGVKQLSLYAAAMNVFTITKYPGNDPETSNDPYSVSGGFMDVSNYPVTRSYTLGVRASF